MKALVALDGSWNLSYRPLHDFVAFVSLMLPIFSQFPSRMRTLSVWLLMFDVRFFFLHDRGVF